MVSTIPPGFEGAWKLAQNPANCQARMAGEYGQTGHTLAQCEADNAEAKFIYNALRSGRPFIPGLDMRAVFAPIMSNNISRERELDSNSRIPPARFTNPTCIGKTNCTTLTMGESMNVVLGNTIEKARRPEPLRTADEQAALQALFKEKQVISRARHEIVQAEQDAQKAAMMEQVRLNNLNDK